MNPIYFDLLLIEPACAIELTSYKHDYLDKQNQPSYISMVLYKIEIDPNDEELQAQYFYLQLDSYHMANNELQVFDKETMAKKYFEEKKSFWQGYKQISKRATLLI